MSGEVARLRNTRQLLRLGEMELWTRDEGVLGLGRWSSGTGTMELRDRDDGAPVPGRLSSGTGTIELRSRGALAPPEVEASVINYPVFEEQPIRCCPVIRSPPPS
ncbi:unnamed protein product [Gadus morhua 'NCC']